MATEHFYRFPFASTITRRISVFALIIHYNDFIGHTCNYVTQMVAYLERLGKNLRGKEAYVEQKVGKPSFSQRPVWRLFSQNWQSSHKRDWTPSVASQAF